MSAKDDNPPNLSPGPTRGWARLLSAYSRRVRAFGTNARFYLLGTFLMGIGHGAIWVHLNLYYRAMGLGEETIGRILSASSFGTVLMAIPAALLIDRVPAQRLFGTAAVLFAVSLGCQLFVTSPWVLGATAFTAGIAFTIHWVAAAPFFMRNTDSEERIYLFGISHAVETGATIVAAVGVGTLVRFLVQRDLTELEGLRWALMVVVVLSFLAFPAFARIDSSPPKLTAKRFRDYLAARDWGLLFRLVFPAFTVGLGAGLVIPFLNLYFRDRFGQDPFQIGGFFAISQFFMVLGFLVGPLLARRLGIILTVVGTELLSIPFFLMLAFTRHLPVAVTAFWMRGALMNMNHPLLTNFAMEMVEPDQQAVTNSVRSLAWNLSWMVSTQAGGWIIERYGFTVPMLITIGLYLGSSVTQYFFFQNHLSVGRSARPAV